MGQKRESQGIKVGKIHHKIINNNLHIHIKVQKILCQNDLKADSESTVLS